MSVQSRKTAKNAVKSPKNLNKGHRKAIQLMVNNIEEKLLQLSMRCKFSAIGALASMAAPFVKLTIDYTFFNPQKLGFLDTLLAQLSNPQQAFDYGMITLGAFVTLTAGGLLADSIARTVRSSYIDALTGAYNQKYLQKYARRKIQNSAVIVIDLDNFKPVNDKYGHQAGDYVLRQAGKIFLSHKRNEDMIYRSGIGDEFLFILPSTDERGAKILLDRLLLEVGKIKYAGKDLNIGFSAGVVISGGDGITNLEKLKNEADKKMYEEKLKRKKSR